MSQCQQAKAQGKSLTVPQAIKHVCAEGGTTELWGKQRKTMSLSITRPQAALRECDFMSQGNGRNFSTVEVPNLDKRLDKGAIN